jgi:hypothetical protein
VMVMVNMGCNSPAEITHSSVSPALSGRRRIDAEILAGGGGRGRICAMIFSLKGVSGSIETETRRPDERMART